MFEKIIPAVRTAILVIDLAIPVTRRSPPLGRLYIHVYIKTDICVI